MLWRRRDLTHVQVDQSNATIHVAEAKNVTAHQIAGKIVSGNTEESSDLRSRGKSQGTGQSIAIGMSFSDLENL